MNLRNFYTTLSALSVVVVWSYWTTLLKVADRWMNDIQYSHGWFIPLFAIYLLYHRREKLADAKLEPSWWCLPFLAAALLLRWVGSYYYFDPLDQFSLVPMMLGLVLAVGGWKAFFWSWPAMLFLTFMVPLPYMLHTGMSAQLQGVSTNMSTYILQTIGLPAVSEGTLIKIDESQVNVAEACSGLGMIVTFVALSVAAVILIASPWWVKVGLLLGAIPLSLICNSVRISTVAVCVYLGKLNREEAATVDFGMGLLTILLGCGLIFVELYVLDHIVVAQDTSREGDVPLPLGASA